jgi:hypothetical protein
MDLGINTANIGAEERWRRMQQRGLLLHVLSVTFSWASLGALSIFLRALMHLLLAPISIRFVLAGAVGGGFTGLLIALFSWRSAKKKAERARELDA